MGQEIGVKIIFFDGVCTLCNSTIDFLLPRIKNDQLKFSSLQGTKAQLLLQTEDLAQLKTIIYFTDNKTYYASDAIIEIAKELHWPWRIFSLLDIFPKGVRDFCYYFISRRRYSLFGKNNSCRIPSESERSRFLL